jgi:hypothetical protein
LVIGFVEHLQIISTSNHSAITNSHTLQFTTAYTKSSQYAVFTGCLVKLPQLPCSDPYWLVTVSQLTRHCNTMTYNNGGSSTSHASTRGECLTTASDLDWSVCLHTLSRLSTRTGLCFDYPDIALYVPSRKHRFPHFPYSCITSL